jgi:hypothetical protein
MTARSRTRKLSKLSRQARTVGEPVEDGVDQRAEGGHAVGHPLVARRQPDALDAAAGALVGEVGNACTKTYSRQTAIRPTVASEQHTNGPMSSSSESSTSVMRVSQA